MSLLYLILLTLRLWSDTIVLVNINKVTNSLDDYHLEYEDMEIRMPKVKPKSIKAKTDVVNAKPSLLKRFKTDIKSRGKQARSIFNYIKLLLKPVKKPSKLSKKAQKEQQKAVRKEQKRGILGIGLLFVVVSIAYSTYMTALFVDGPTMVIALTPQVIFAVIILFIAFYKIYK